ncbi:DNA-processing protein DprA [Streptomyces sp. PLK6-54]|uniref:DNA-processing protein DprA n=1 Tax=Actinacidiphila acidipaludis TaxID=2873382 RepID=A0ABS7QCE6_9ACTN|nr:DNA-processing protein DprA [Streptomyces acidipaludis]
MDDRREPGLIKGGRQLLLQILQAVEPTRLHLDAEIRLPQDQIRFGTPVPSAEVERDTGASELRAGNQLGADDHEVVVRLGPEEVPLRLPEVQGLGALQGPDDVVERLQDGPSEARGVVAIFRGVEKIPQGMGGGSGTHPGRERGKEVRRVHRCPSRSCRRSDAARQPSHTTSVAQTTAGSFQPSAPTRITMASPLDLVQRRFVLRNRVIAALTRGTVVVEARYRSGSLITARRATALGRITIGVPGPCTSGLSEGVHELLRKDAVVVTDAAEVLEMVGEIGADLAPVRRGAALPRDRLPAATARVLEALPGHGTATAEDLAAAAGAGVPDTLGRLHELRALGFVERTDTGWMLVRTAHEGRPGRTG